MSRPSVRTALATALCTLAPFGLIACGGGGGKPTTADTGAATGATAPIQTTGTTGTAATTTGTGTTASNPIVAIFFNTIKTESVKRGLSPKLADCIVAQLRMSISTQDIADLVKSGGKPNASMQQKIAAASQTCVTSGGK